MEINSETFLIRGLLALWTLIAMALAVGGGLVLSIVVIPITVWLYLGGLVRLLEFFGIELTSERYTRR